MRPDTNTRRFALHGENRRAIQVSADGLEAMAAILAKPQAAPFKSDKKVKITQVGSPIGRETYQEATLKGLGLNRLNRSRVLEDTPSVRGMIERVRHLVRVESAS